MAVALDTIAKQARTIFDEYACIDLLVVFGSASTGDSHAGSDLDIAVLPLRSLDMSLMEELRLQHALSVATGLEVDLVRLDQTTPLVKHEVARHGSPLLERSPGAFRRFAAEATLEYLDLLPLLEAGRVRYLARIALGRK